MSVDLLLSRWCVRVSVPVSLCACLCVFVRLSLTRAQTCVCACVCVCARACMHADAVRVRACTCKALMHAYYVHIHVFVWVCVCVCVRVCVVFPPLHPSDVIIVWEPCGKPVFLHLAPSSLHRLVHSPSVRSRELLVSAMRKAEDGHGPRPDPRKAAGIGGRMSAMQRLELATDFVQVIFGNRALSSEVQRSLAEMAASLSEDMPAPKDCRAMSARSLQAVRTCTSRHTFSKVLKSTLYSAFT
jgi:hypothetical protein